MEFQIESGVPAPETSVPKPEPTLKEKVAVKANFENISATGVVLNNWKHAKEEYDKAKQILDDAKKNVFAHIGQQIDVGTNRFGTERFILKATKAEKYNIVVSNINLLNVCLDRLANVSSVEIARDVIQWKPTLNKKVYDNLTYEQKQILVPFLELSYSTPTLSIEEI